jgi:hypothetical protein
MNYVKDVCTKVLGLDWEGDRSSKFTISVRGENPIKHCYVGGYGFIDNDIDSLNIPFMSIVNGTFTFTKELKLVPFYDCPIGDKYYYVDVKGLTVQETNDGETFDWMCKKLKNMFETDQISQEQIDTIVKSLKYNDKGDIK